MIIDQFTSGDSYSSSTSLRTEQRPHVDGNRIFNSTTSSKQSRHQITCNSAVEDSIHLITTASLNTNINRGLQPRTYNYYVLYVYYVYDCKLIYHADMSINFFKIHNVTALKYANLWEQWFHICLHSDSGKLREQSSRQRYSRRRADRSLSKASNMWHYRS